MRPDLDALADRLAVQDVLVDLLWHVDRRQWQQAKALLTESVYLDYTSLNSGEPAVAAREDVVAAWASVLGGFTATQHLLGVPRVSLAANQARLEANFVASHSLPDALGASLWTLGGFYIAELARADAGWRITSLTMIATWGTGNQHLNAKAAQRVAGGT